MLSPRHLLPINDLSLNREEKMTGLGLFGTSLELSSLSLQNTLAHIYQYNARGVSIRVQVEPVYQVHRHL